MLPLTVAELIGATGGLLVLGDPQTVLGGLKVKNNEETRLPTVSTDSRTLKSGDIFFALKGERYDGHDFLNEALALGAQLCFASRFPNQLLIPPGTSPSILKVRDTKKALQDAARYYRQKVGGTIQMIGITGSCGKTTVKEMLAQILARASPTVYNPGNFNNEIGCPRSIFLMDEDHRFGVFEIGASRANEVRRLSEIVRPNLAILTNIHLEHTATFGSLEQIAEGESEVFGSLSENGIAVLPADDPFYEYLKSRVPKDRKIEIISFGFSSDARVSASQILEKQEPGRNSFFTTFTIQRSENKKIMNQFSVDAPFLGKFNVLNATAAAAAALALKVPEELIQKGLAHFVSPQMRFQISVLPSNILLVNDCYNANPASMKAALESFIQSFADREKAVVLGDMLELGEISRQEHYSLGQYLATLPLSKIVLYGHQTRFTAEGAKDSFVHSSVLFYSPDKENLFKEVKSLLKPGMAILFKASRGMALEEVISQCSIT